MKLCSIASGSSGNCIYVSSDTTHILIDAGVSGRRIEQGFLSIGVSPEDLNAVLITHEHSDHIQGLGVIARKYHVPVYSTTETLNAAVRSNAVGLIGKELIHPVIPNKAFMIGDIKVTPFSVMHDARDPVCYTFESGGHKIGMATDLGMYDDYIVSMLAGSEILYIEANHDVNMLMVGKYPYKLKQRILGERGHLSNDSTAALICRLLHDGMKDILLAHMSKDNNYAELAYETVRIEVEKNWNRLTKVPSIVVANRDIPSQVVIV